MMILQNIREPFKLSQLSLLSSSSDCCLLAWHRPWFLRNHLS
jgi:hypothetical protein